jgi:hypothetical protein
MIGLDAGEAGVIVALITAIIAPTVAAVIAMLNRKDIKTINNSVNHVGVNEPTLISRVKAHDVLLNWLVHSVASIGAQVGVDLPELPVTKKDVNK